jgi:NAD(P)-dependent dehydrogenase (short-subunit alcohol dehydrogenase family)
MMEWRDQVAVVTGGARGLGRATAWLLAQRGAAVCVNYAAHGDAAEALIAEIAAAGNPGGLPPLRYFVGASGRYVGFTCY